MVANRRFLNVFTVTLPVLTCIPAIHAAEFIPVEQQRSVSSFVIVPPCFGGDDFASATATTFDPFDEKVVSTLACEQASGLGLALQQSTIGSQQISAFGNTFSEATAAIPEVIHAISGSSFDLDFEIDTDSQVTLNVVLNASSSSSAAGVGIGSFFELVDVDDDALFSATVTPGDRGELTTISFEETINLSAGVYTLNVDASAIIDAQLPPNLAGDASYNVTLTITDTCFADLDEDGQVGPSDLALLLGVWGAAIDCAGASCPDLDLSGLVDASDLALLLGAWGQCE